MFKVSFWFFCFTPYETKLLQQKEIDSNENVAEAKSIDDLAKETETSSEEVVVVEEAKSTAEEIVVVELAESTTEVVIEEAESTTEVVAEEPNVEEVASEEVEEVVEEVSQVIAFSKVLSPANHVLLLHTV